MASVSFKITNLLEKMTSSDKDFRFMATNDLMSELQQDNVKLDDESERKIVLMLLHLLSDKNGEVQNLAVKCFAPLVKKVKQNQVETMVDCLCLNMTSSSEQLKDISSIGLKNIINELRFVPNSLAANVSKRITGRLCNAIEQQNVSIQLEVLEILTELLGHFGSALHTFHPVILCALYPQLRSSRQAVRKRTIVALSRLVLSCNPDLFDKLIGYLIEGLSTNENSTPTFIQCIAAICQQAGYRFDEYIDKIVPLIFQYTNSSDEDLRQHCLQVFEAFINRCPKKISPYIENITNLCLQLITYDPNYNYDVESDEEDEEDVESRIEMEELYEECDDYYDNDDMSWKVRRAAAKCLTAVISTRNELLSEFYRTVSPALIVRFKEREEIAKEYIFNAYITIIRQTKPGVVVSLDYDSMEQEDLPVLMLRAQVPSIVGALKPEMKNKSVKTRQCCFNLLKELIAILPNTLSDHILALIPGIQYSLDKKNSSDMKIDTLIFIHRLLESHQPEVFHPHLDVLVPPILAAIDDSFYKVTTEALLVLQQLVKVIRPLDPPSDCLFTEFITDLYASTYICLKSSFTEQEVKEEAISCMGQIMCNLGDYLIAEIQFCFPIFLGSLKNEITRLTTIKSLIKIASSPLKIDLPFIDEAIQILASFLRKNQRTLKLNTLTLLNILVQNYTQHLYADLLRAVLREVPPLLNDIDLQIAQLAVVLLTSIVRLQSDAFVDVSDAILSEIFVLVKSSLLQGAALDSILEFLQALVNCSLPGLSYQDVLKMLLSQVSSSIHKQAFHSLAKCVAAVTIIFPNEILPVVERFMQDVTNRNNVNQHVCALLVIGEIGRYIDLSSVNNLKQLVLDSFTYVSEEVKSAASYTLGNISIGNLPEYLPFVLEAIETEPRRQYLLLHSLKEIISSQSVNEEGVQKLLPFVPAIWALLFKNCECNEEGIRNIVAECLGKLTLIDPEILPKLQEYLSSPSSLIRATVVTAIKFTISDQSQSIHPLLRQCIGQFLVSLQDPDLNVRTIALLTINSAAHNKPSLIRDLLGSIMPQIYSETKIRKELIREIEMGPFKHTVDDGLDLRRAAFECMFTLLDSCLDKLDIFEFLDHLESGLKDHYNIKMLSYLMIARLAQLCPNVMLKRLDRLVEILKVTCNMKVKANSVKQECDKQEELKRSAMRAVATLWNIPDADKNVNLEEFISQIRSTMDLRYSYELALTDQTGLMDCFVIHR